MKRTGMCLMPLRKSERSRSTDQRCGSPGRGRGVFAEAVDDFEPALHEFLLTLRLVT